MAEEQDDAEKTEEPTSKKMEEALKSGNVVSSKEVSSFVMLLFLTLLIWLASPSIFREAFFKLSSYIARPHDMGGNYMASDIIELIFSISKELLAIALIPFSLSVLASISGNFIQRGFILSPEAIKIDASKLSPLKGLARIFSIRSLVEFIKGIIKVIIIGVAVYLAVKPELAQIYNIYQASFAGILALIFHLVLKMLITVCIIMGIIAVVDFFYQKYEHIKGLKMTKQEVKDEMKQLEGNPEIKARLRKIRQERAKQRIATAVPKANVVITNPSHYAIALLYNEDEMPAPKVVAKGVDEVAGRIRELAKQHMVPIMRNPPLARSLYQTCDVDEFIPANQYRAVAQIFAELEKMQQKRKRA